MWRAILALAALISVAAIPWAMAQSKAGANTSAQIDYTGFRNLTGEVDSVRQQRLVSLAEFQRMAREGDTLILDARSADAYAEGHIAGAINLPFTDFTDQSLAAAIARSEPAHPHLLQQQFREQRPPGGAQAR